MDEQLVERLFEYTPERDQYMCSHDKEYYITKMILKIFGLEINRPGFFKRHFQKKKWKAESEYLTLEEISEALCKNELAADIDSAKDIVWMLDGSLSHDWRLHKYTNSKKATYRFEYCNPEEGYLRSAYISEREVEILSGQK